MSQVRYILAFVADITILLFAHLADLNEEARSIALWVGIILTCVTIVKVCVQTLIDLENKKAAKANRKVAEEKERRLFEEKYREL